MKFFISNNTEAREKFGKWHYWADSKCKVVQHGESVYIYFGYLIDDDLEQQVVNNFDGLIKSNGAFTCVKITKDKVEVVVDYFSRYKVFAHKRGDLIEISNQISLFSLTTKDLDIKELQHRLAIPERYMDSKHMSGETAGTWTQYHPDLEHRDSSLKEFDPYTARTVFKNVYMLEPGMKLCATTRIYRIRIADYHTDVSNALKDETKFDNTSALEDFIHERMLIHADTIKRHYNNIHCTLSEGIDSVLQTMYFKNSDKSMYTFKPETVPWKTKKEVIDHFGTVHVDKFDLENMHKYCEKYSTDPSCHDFDCLPSYSALKNLTPKADIVLYGAGGDQMFMHRRQAMQSQIFQMLYDESTEKVADRYNRYVEQHKQSYSMRTNIKGADAPTLQTLYKNMDWNNEASAIETLANFHRWPRDMHDYSLPKKITLGLYCRQISAECDTEVTSLFCDLSTFFEVFRLPLKTRLESTIDVSLQRNMLTRHWNYAFKTPFKDGASFNTYKMIRPYYKHSIANVFQTKLVDEIAKDAEA